MTAALSSIWSNIRKGERVWDLFLLAHLYLAAISLIVEAVLDVVVLITARKAGSAE